MWLLAWICVAVMLCSYGVIECQDKEIKELKKDIDHLEWMVKQDKYHEALQKWIKVMEK